MAAPASPGGHCLIITVKALVRCPASHAPLGCDLGTRQINMSRGTFHTLNQGGQEEGSRAPTSAKAKSWSHHVLLCGLGQSQTFEPPLELGGRTPVVTPLTA